MIMKKKIADPEAPGKRVYGGKFNDFFFNFSMKTYCDPLVRWVTKYVFVEK